LPAAGRELRLHRGAGPRAGPRRQGGQVPVHRERQGPRPGRRDRLRQDHQRRQVRRAARRPHDRPGRHRAAARADAGPAVGPDGARGGPERARAPDAQRGGQGGDPRAGRSHDQHVSGRSIRGGSSPALARSPLFGHRGHIARECQRAMATPAGTRQPLAPAPARGSRLGWLDALRAVAALVVVYEHALNPLFPELRSVTGPWFDAGMYGVMVFFLVSGYVIPASLERRGSVAGFWIGRLCRRYLLWAVAVAAALLLAVAGVDPMHIWLTQRPASAVLGHLTMLQDLLNVPNVLNVLWTLSYEMAFY